VQDISLGVFAKDCCICALRFHQVPKVMMPHKTAIIAPTKSPFCALEAGAAAFFGGTTAVELGAVPGGVTVRFAQPDVVGNESAPLTAAVVAEYMQEDEFVAL
jgi:hypothetical protein